MKKLMVVAFVVLLWGVRAEAQQSCAKCYVSLEGPMFCGLSTYNAGERCELKHPYECHEYGSCIGTDGAECKLVCVQRKWVDANLPEKSRWVIASVTIEKPRKTS